MSHQLTILSSAISNNILGTGVSPHNTWQHIDTAGVAWDGIDSLKCNFESALNKYIYLNLK